MLLSTPTRTSITNSRSGVDKGGNDSLSEERNSGGIPRNGATAGGGGKGGKRLTWARALSSADDTVLRGCTSRPPRNDCSELPPAFETLNRRSSALRPSKRLVSLPPPPSPLPSATFFLSVLLDRMLNVDFWGYLSRHMGRRRRRWRLV